MDLKYNIYFELCACIFIFMQVVFLRLFSTDKSKKTKTFRQLVFSAFLALVLDIITAITISYAAIIPIWINAVLNSAYFIMDVILEFAFLNYVGAYVIHSRPVDDFIKINEAIAVLYSISVALSQPLRLYFYFDKQGNYLKGPLYGLTFALPMYFILVAIGLIHVNKSYFNKRQSLSLSLFALFCVVGVSLQLLFFPEVLLSLFVGSLGITFITFAVEIPDYNRLIKSKENRTKLILQMTQDMKMPINAILGYDEAILHQAKETGIRESAKNIREFASVVLENLEGFLDFAENGSNSVEINEEIYYFAEALQDIYTILKYEAKGRNINLTMEADQDFPSRLYGDGKKIVRIINNITYDVFNYSRYCDVKILIQWVQTGDNDGNIVVRVTADNAKFDRDMMEEMKIAIMPSNIYDEFYTNICGIGLSSAIQMLVSMNGDFFIDIKNSNQLEYSAVIPQGICARDVIGKDVMNSFETVSDDNELTGIESVDIAGDILNQISYLDYSTGLSYCHNDVDFYIDCLKIFAEDTLVSDLDKLSAENDLAGYSSILHTVRSNGIIVGATIISEKAKDIDEKITEGLIVDLSTVHQEFIEDFKELINEINFSLDAINRMQNASDLLDDEKVDVLVVDSDKMNLNIIQKMLGDRYNISTAETGEQAKEILLENKPPICLLETSLIDTDGFEIAKFIVKDNSLQNTAFIFLTSNQNNENETKAFEYGASDFIRKPLSASVLISRIDRVITYNKFKLDMEKAVKRQTRQIEEKSDENIAQLMSAIESLARTIDAKDGYTKGHSSRVAEYAKMIAKRLDFSKDDLNNIYNVALLHDIGKIAVPDDIIKKPDKLTVEEYSVIKTHPSEGEKIVGAINTIPNLREGVRYHHERYDGKGYPDGLKGTEIPLIARIIAVADTYDAMSSSRAYRKALNQSEIREEFVKFRGLQFDPILADIMIQIIDEDKDYNLRQ